MTSATRSAGGSESQNSTSAASASSKVWKTFVVQLALAARLSSASLTGAMIAQQSFGAAHEHVHGEPGPRTLH